jgi:hypothetical protein
MAQVQGQLLERLSSAEKAVEDQSVTWTGTGLLGRVKIAFASKAEAAAAKAALEEAIDYANSKAQDAVREALDLAVSSSAWGWRDGSRDIVDSGTLRDSLQFERDGDGFSFYYTAPYAALVHYGGYIKPYGNPKIDAVYIPGRPWVDAVMEGGGPVPVVNLDAIYDEAVTRAFR